VVEYIYVILVFISLFVLETSVFQFELENGSLAESWRSTAGHAASVCRTDEESDALATALSSCVLCHGVAAARHSQPVHSIGISPQDRIVTSA